MRVVSIVGARPQFIKASVVSKELIRAGVEEIVVHTGQHYDYNMSEIFFNELGLPKPLYRFTLKGRSHAQMSAEMLVNIEQVLISNSVDLVLLYGDTNSTLAGALAAAKLSIPIAHIEAGVRSFNKKMPEEINRILTDRVSTLLFCPTNEAIRNLKNEGIKENLFLVGDVMQDVAMSFNKFAKKPDFDISAEFFLATVHRAENCDDESRLESIFRALELIAKNTQVVLPLHPRVLKIVESKKIGRGITLVDPVPFFEMIWLLKSCKMVLTDSGGLQKEAYFYKKPCITLRDESEWVESIENNYNVLAGANSDKIVSLINHKFNTNFSKNLYGNGDSSIKIVKKILEFFNV